LQGKAGRRTESRDKSCVSGWLIKAKGDEEAFSSSRPTQRGGGHHRIGPSKERPNSLRGEDKSLPTAHYPTIEKEPAGRNRANPKERHRMEITSPRIPKRSDEPGKSLRHANASGFPREKERDPGEKGAFFTNYTRQTGRWGIRPKKEAGLN